MHRHTRLRRIGILCLHCLRNAAYYRAWNAAPQIRRREQFWISLNGNFIDTCLLEWCKLFGDLRAMHHWSKVVSDPTDFLARLHESTKLDTAQFEAYRLEVRMYRDKFVAHLDNLNSAQIPRIQPAIDSARLLYNYLVAEEDDAGAFHNAPRSANAQYQNYLREGRAAHRA